MALVLLPEMINDLFNFPFAKHFVSHLFLCLALLKMSFGKAKINRLGSSLYIEQYRVFFQKLWFSDKH